MISDLPPKLWLPPKPAIIRPADKKLLVPALGSFLPGMFPAGAAAPSSQAGALTFLDSTATDLSPDAATATFTARNIGTPSADRRVIVAAMTFQASSHSITGVTVAGNLLTLHVNLNSGNGLSSIAIGSVKIASGSTGDVVISSSGNIDMAGIGIWSLTGETSSSPNDTASDNTGVITGSFPTTTNTYSDTIDIPSHGALVAAGCAFDDGGTGVTWSGATQDFSRRTSTVWKSTGASASALASEAGRTIQLVFNSTTSLATDGVLAAISWAYA
jgi:hypothetical protein